MRRTSLILMLLCAGALALAGCGDSDGGGSSSSTAAPAATASDGDVQVVMKDISFQPKTVAARVGQTITWVNEDDVLHDAVAEDGAFESELFGNGKSFSWTADRAGTFAYVCTIHPGMEGTVTVAR